MDKVEIRKLEIDKQKFESLRTDSQFISILLLARVINALTFCLQSYKDYADSDSPVALRQRFRSFFILMGFLHESFILLEKLEKQFTGEKSFDNSLGKIINNKTITDFRNDFLIQARNTSSFHFETKVVTQTLKKLDLNQYILISGESSDLFGMYFPLADELDMNFWVRHTNDKKEEKEQMEKIISLSTKIAIEFIDLAEKFMFEMYQKLP